MEPCDDYQGNLQPFALCITCGEPYSDHQEYKDALAEAEGLEFEDALYLLKGKIDNA